MPVGVGNEITATFKTIDQTPFYSTQEPCLFLELVQTNYDKYGMLDNACLSLVTDVTLAHYDWQLATHSSLNQRTYYPSLWLHAV
jgi:hypothetical protein